MTDIPPDKPARLTACGYVLFTLCARAVETGLRITSPLTRLVLRCVRLARLRAMVDGVIPVTTQFDGPVSAFPRSRVTLGVYCRLCRGVYFEAEDDGRITLGKHVFVNVGTMIVSHAAIEIGDYAMIGEYVSIRDTNHGVAAGQLVKAQASVSESIRIGRDVWIGRGCAVLKGVTIGDGAVIGANSVVTKDIPANAIAVGSPARVVRCRGGSEPRSRQHIGTGADD